MVDAVAVVVVPEADAEAAEPKTPKRTLKGEMQGNLLDNNHFDVSTYGLPRSSVSAICFPSLELASTNRYDPAPFPRVWSLSGPVLPVGVGPCPRSQDAVPVFSKLHSPGSNLKVPLFFSWRDRHDQARHGAVSGDSRKNDAGVGLQRQRGRRADGLALFLFCARALTCPQSRS